MKVALSTRLSGTLFCSKMLKSELNLLILPGADVRRIANYQVSLPGTKAKLKVATEFIQS
jgi:hypothetical protein